MKFKIFRFKKVESTNNIAIKIIKNSNIDYGMIVSNIQKKGRGQYGKKWISYNGNLFVTFFYKFDDLKVSLKRTPFSVFFKEINSLFASCSINKR